MVNFSSKDTVIDSVKCFLEVYKNCDCNVIVIKCISYFIADVNKSIINRVFFSKPISVFKDAFVLFR